jgi:alanine racemase
LVNRRQGAAGAGASLAPAVGPQSDPSNAAEIDLRTSIRPTVAEVDLGAIARNHARLRAIVGDAAIWAVIKADAYGHGAVPVARRLASAADALAVSLVEEGLELRAAGIRAPIVVLGAYFADRHGDVLEEGLLPVVYDPGDLERFAAAAAAARRIAAVHLKVDTGMSRLGVAPEALPAVLERAAAYPSLKITGLATHLPCADAPDPQPTEQALAAFRRCLQMASHAISGVGPAGLCAHAANSAAAVRFPGLRFDAVRPGLALYGVLPAATVSVAGIEPAMKLTTRVMAVREVAAGVSVSYGGVWRAARPSRIATLPVGYADGYPRHVKDAEVLIRGRRAPIAGAVCMDMMMADVTDVPGADIGDAVTLIGRDGTQEIAVDDLARWAGTIAYEVLCGISKRVPRIYKG